MEDGRNEDGGEDEELSAGEDQDEILQRIGRRTGEPTI